MIWLGFFHPAIHSPASSYPTRVLPIITFFNILCPCRRSLTLHSLGYRALRVNARSSCWGVAISWVWMQRVWLSYNTITCHVERVLSSSIGTGLDFPSQIESFLSTYPPLSLSLSLSLLRLLSDLFSKGGLGSPCSVSSRLPPPPSRATASLQDFNTPTTWLIHQHSLVRFSKLCYALLSEDTRFEQLSLKTSRQVINLTLK